MYVCDLKWPIIQHKTIAWEDHSELQMFDLRGSVVKCLPNIYKDLDIKKTKQNKHNTPNLTSPFIL